MKEREGIKYNEPWILQRADPYVYRHTDGEEVTVWTVNGQKKGKEDFIMKEREGIKYNEPWILQRADPYVYRHTDGEEVTVWTVNGQKKGKRDDRYFVTD